MSLIEILFFTLNSIFCAPLLLKKYLLLLIMHLVTANRTLGRYAQRRWFQSLKSVERIDHGAMSYKEHIVSGLISLAVNMGELSQDDAEFSFHQFQD